MSDAEGDNADNMSFTEWISDSESESDDDDSPEYCDDDLDHSEDLKINESDDPLLEPPAPLTGNIKLIKNLVTWLLYFLLLWQFKYMVSDNELESFLKFIKSFFVCIGKHLAQHWGIEFVSTFATYIPCTLYSLYNYLGIDRDAFTKYAVCGCRGCHQIYNLDNLLNRGEDGQVKKRVCDNCLKRRGNYIKCGHSLVKEVITSDGKIRYYPKFVYFYKSVIMKIKSFFKRPRFQERCESWRKREPLQNEYGDIYDGRVWKEFLTRTGKDFLKEKGSLCLMLNVDWFSPFKHRRDYSVGALYISIMNLPREERFLKENILLAGIIPAMQKEPDKSIS